MERQNPFEVEDRDQDDFTDQDAWEEWIDSELLDEPYEEYEEYDQNDIDDYEVDLNDGD